MPQFDITTFPTQVFWLAIAFTTLYVLLAWLAIPRIERVLGERRGRIEGDIDEAARLKAEADAALAAYEAGLERARGEGKTIAARAAEAAASEAARHERAAAERLAAEAQLAERRIAESRAAALANVRAIASDAARAGTKRLLGLDVAQDKADRAVASVVAERG